MSETNEACTYKMLSARYKAERDQARQRIAGLMKFVDDLDDENEHLRDMLNDVAWKLGIGREVHYLSGDNYDECHKRVLGEISKLSSPTSYDVAQVTASAYDLLPEEDRKAMRWVREKGGVEVMKRSFYAVCQQAEDGRLFALSVTRLLHSYDEVYGDGGLAERDDMEDLLEEELEKRLMPEGMEWPRYEDGEPVELGGEFENAKGNVSTLRTVIIKDCRGAVGGGIFWKLGKGACAMVLKNGERVKRPAVLAADGKPLEVGQTVWDANGDEFRVLDLYGGPVDEDFPDHTVRCRRAGAEDYESTMCEPSQLTHQRPVLDAGGVPIELGDDLYIVEGGLKLHVSNIDRVNCKIATSAMFALDKWADPSMFTHAKPEPPDSWERIEEDADALVEAEDNGVGSFSAANDYCERHGLENGTVWVMMARDLVRRCKALAERGE